MKVNFSFGRKTSSQSDIHPAATSGCPAATCLQSSQLCVRACVRACMCVCSVIQCWSQFTDCCATAFLRSMKACFILPLSPPLPLSISLFLSLYLSLSITDMHTHSFDLRHASVSLTGSVSVSQYLPEFSCSRLYSLLFHLYFHLSSSLITSSPRSHFHFLSPSRSLSLTVGAELSKVSQHLVLRGKLFLSSELTDRQLKQS